MKKLCTNTEENNNKTNGGNPVIKNMRKQLKNEKGLTLIELLAVIVIIAIVAAIAIPAIGNIIENSRYNAVKADALNVLNAGQMYYLDEGEDGEDPVEVSTLQADGYLESRGKIPVDASVSKDSPHRLTTEDFTFSGSKTVEFKGVTIEDINADDQKGSDGGNLEIEPVVTP